MSAAATIVEVLMRREFEAKGVFPTFDQQTLESTSMQEVFVHLNEDTYRGFRLALDLGMTPDAIRDLIRADNQALQVAGPEGHAWLHTVLECAIAERPVRAEDIAYLDPQKILAAELTASTVKNNLLVGMTHDSIAQLPVKKLREHIPALKRRALEDFNQALDNYVADVEIPDALVEYHRAGLNRFFEKILTRPRLFNAASRVMSYYGGKDPDPIFYRDLMRLQTALSQAFGIIRPTTEFNTEVMDKVAGSATYVRAPEGNGQNNWHFKFVNRLWLYQKGRGHISGGEILEYMMHETLHTIEDAMLERLFGMTHGLVKRQRAHFRQDGLDEWPLKEAAVKLAINSDWLGRYIPLEENEDLYDKQLRERHAKWFARQALRLVADCVRKYKTGALVLGRDGGDRTAFKTDFLESLSGARASLSSDSKIYTRAMADLIPFDALAEKVHGIDVNGPQGLREMRQAITRYMVNVLGARDAVHRKYARRYGGRKVTANHGIRTLQNMGIQARHTLELLEDLQKDSKPAWRGFMPPKGFEDPMIGFRRVAAVLIEKIRSGEIVIPRPKL